MIRCSAFVAPAIPFFTLLRPSRWFFFLSGQRITCLRSKFSMAKVSLTTETNFCSFLLCPGVHSHELVYREGDRDSCRRWIRGSIIDFRIVADGIATLRG